MNRPNLIRLVAWGSLFAIYGTALAGDLKPSRFSAAGSFPVEGSPRSIVNFNPGWRFFKGDAKGAEAVDFDDSQWEAANLPHGLEILGENASGGRNYQGIAWYRKQFRAKPQVSGGRVFLYFEAVMGRAKVYVNEQKVAEHFGGYLPFAADITDVVKPNGEANFVAVMADNSDSKLYPPGKNQDGLDFTYMGGIYRDTYLIETGPVHVTLRELSNTVAGGGIFAATLDVTGKDAKLEVRTEVSNSGPKAANVTVRNVLEDAEGKELVSVEQQETLAGGATSQLARQFEAKNVRLWHPDDPYLHFIRTDVILDGKVVDSLRTRIGIRLFEMRGPDGLFINKEWVGKKLIGVNRHQDYVYIGNAMPNSLHWRDVKLLREGGCNIIRAGHYPQDPAFYDACDELGMLTTTANPGWHFFNFKEKIFEDRLYEDTRNLVRRDRNVASILMWETALNETPQQPDHAMNNMHKAAHEEYPFPGIYTVTDHQEAKKGGLDIYYHGNDPNVNSFNREYGDGGEVDNWNSQNATTRVNMEWGERALVVQSLMQAETLASKYTTPRVQLGGALWAGIDHQRGYHPDPFMGGLLNMYRLPRYTYYLYKSQYSPDFELPGVETGPMLFNTNELTQISPADVVIYSNCEEVRLTWLGEVIGTKKPSSEKKYAGLPHPPFIFENVFDFSVIKSKWHKNTGDIQMVAEGLINDQVVATEAKDYAQRTTGLKLSVSDEGMELVADGSDIMPVRAVVIDESGTKKVLASEYVLFEVEGPAEIVGNASTHANPMKTELGVATALIRATMEPGEIKVTAHSPGLKSGTISLTSRPPGLKMNFDKDYAASSKKPELDMFVISTVHEDSDLPVNVRQLQDDLRKARLEITGKEQDIMELRGQLGR